MSYDFTKHEILEARRSPTQTVIHFGVRWWGWRERINGVYHTTVPMYGAHEQSRAWWITEHEEADWETGETYTECVHHYAPDKLAMRACDKKIRVDRNPTPPAGAEIVQFSRQGAVSMREMENAPQALLQMKMDELLR